MGAIKAEPPELPRRWMSLRQEVHASRVWGSGVHEYAEGFGEEGKELESSLCKPIKGSSACSSSLPAIGNFTGRIGIERK
eukprot:gene4619-2330_t